jgi:hypothetical protein
MSQYISQKVWKHQEMGISITWYSYKFHEYLSFIGYKLYIFEPRE